MSNQINGKTIQSDLTAPFQWIKPRRIMLKHLVPMPYEWIEQIEKSSIKIQSCLKDALSKKLGNGETKLKRSNNSTARVIARGLKNLLIDWSCSSENSCSAAGDVRTCSQGILKRSYRTRSSMVAESDCLYDHRQDFSDASRRNTNQRYKVNQVFLSSDHLV